MSSQNRSQGEYAATQSSVHGRKLARMTDVASRAGVSTATVDRVLNRRPGVRSTTVQRVLRAAAELDYVLDADQHPALNHKPMRLAFLLPAGTNRYLSMLGRLIMTSQEQLASFNVRARVELTRSFNPELLAHHLRQSARNADGVCFIALEHPAVREAVNSAAERGVPTVTLISDISNTRRIAYIGLDNRSAAGPRATSSLGSLVPDQRKSR